MPTAFSGLRTPRSAHPTFCGRMLQIIPFCLLVIAVALAPNLQAQFRASLRGAVTDPSGAVIPDATVTLTDTQTNATQTTTSNAEGVYTFNGLAPAPYKLSVSHAGFETKVFNQVEIIPEQANQLNLQLQISQAQTTVTVSGTTHGLPTENATLSATISSNEIQHMPSYNRDVFQLAQLTPGAIADASRASGGGTYNLPGNQGPGGSSSGNAGIFATENGPQVQDLGSQYETNGISIDGISTTSAVWGGTSIITPTEDSVQDMHVVANAYDAEYGRFSGAQIQVTTKSGSNTVHGSAFFKASRPGLNAFQRWNGTNSNQPASCAPGTPVTKKCLAASRGVNRDVSRFNNWGGSLGGPFWRNKLFGFFAFETSPFSSSSTAQGWYETTQFDQSGAVPGSIASKYLSYKGEGAASSAILNKNCGDAGLTEGVNCRTVAGGLDIGSPLKTGLGHQDLTYGGSSSTPGVGGGLDGVPDIAFFNTVNPTKTSQIQYNGRLDANVTGKDHLTFAIYWVPLTTTNYNGPVRPANLWHHSQVNDAFSVIWNHIFSPSLINQARANAAGWRWNEVNSNSQEPFGLPQDNFDAPGSTGGQGGLQFFGAPGPSDLNQWTYDYNDVLTKVWGNHSIKAGGDWTRLYYLNNPIYAARPQFTFHNVWDFSNDAPYRESGEFNHSTGLPFSNRQDDRENILGFFVQDDWKVRPNLTLNLGVRWSYFGAYYSTENNLDVMRFGTGSNPLNGLHMQVGGNQFSPPKGDWGPQVGFSWQPRSSNGKAVLRGGFGVNYNQNEIAILANGFGNPPNAVQPTFHCDYPAFLTNPTCSGSGILYQTATSINSIFGYPPNPAAITQFNSANLPLTGATFLTGFPYKPKNIVNYHYSLEADYQLTNNDIATLGYQGTQMRHLLTQYNWLAVAAQRGLAFNPSVNFIDFYDNTSNGNFNSMVATLNHTFSHTFQAQAQYLWGKAMDEESGPYYEDYYPYDVHAAYGLANYNVGNQFKVFGLWQPIIFRGSHSWAEKVVGGWNLSGIWNWHTGFPFDPVYNIQCCLYYGSSGYGQLRPAGHVGGAGTNTGNAVFQGFTMQGNNHINPNYGGNATQYFPAPTYKSGPSFPNAAPGPPPGIHRNSLTGPRYNDIDASLAKDFGMPSNHVLGEGASFEIRADAYNLFNETNINTQQIDNTLGFVSPTGTVTPNSHFGVANNALGSRTVQLQARFSF
ncbi:MAG TPA: TonB-dependent receptor [Acidobacteriaceae bacterium]|nr:TonB-dependent receptor [Acidobacteriaceae bacterium]